MPIRLLLLFAGAAVVVASLVFKVRVAVASAKLFLALLLIGGVVVVLALLGKRQG